MSFNWRGGHAYYTRSFVRANMPRGRHPWIDRGLPSPPPLDPTIIRRPRGRGAEGHEGALAFEEWDTSSLPDPDDEPLELGELMFPGNEAGAATTHVRAKKGGYVDIVSHVDLVVEKSKEERAKRRGLRARKEMRRGVVGASRRRWVWRNGKPGGKGKKKVGSQRGRDAKGRLLGRGRVR